MMNRFALCLSAFALCASAAPAFADMLFVTVKASDLDKAMRADAAPALELTYRVEADSVKACAQKTAQYSKAFSIDFKAIQCGTSPDLPGQFVFGIKMKTPKAADAKKDLRPAVDVVSRSSATATGHDVSLHLNKAAGFSDPLFVSVTVVNDTERQVDMFSQSMGLAKASVPIGIDDGAKLMGGDTLTLRTLEPIDKKTYASEAYLVGNIVINAR